MTRIELQIDQDVLARARRLAEKQNDTLESLVERFIEGVARSTAIEDPLIGMSAHAPELADAIVSSAYEARERDPLRRNNGG